MITLELTYTARSPHPTSRYAAFHRFTKDFETLHDAKTWLASEYFYCKKRKPVYIDTAAHGMVECGWMYCYKEVEDRKTHYRQDWVAVYEVDKRPLDVTTAA